MDKGVKSAPSRSENGDSAAAAASARRWGVSSPMDTGEADFAHLEVANDDSVPLALAVVLPVAPMLLPHFCIAIYCFTSIQL